MQYYRGLPENPNHHKLFNKKTRKMMLSGDREKINGGIMRKAESPEVSLLEGERIILRGKTSYKSYLPPLLSLIILYSTIMSFSPLFLNTLISLQEEYLPLSLSLTYFLLGDSPSILYPSLYVNYCISSLAKLLLLVEMGDIYFPLIFTFQLLWLIGCILVIVRKRGSLTYVPFYFSGVLLLLFLIISPYLLEKSQFFSPILVSLLQPLLRDSPSIILYSATFVTTAALEMLLKMQHIRPLVIAAFMILWLMYYIFIMFGERGFSTYFITNMRVIIIKVEKVHIGFYHVGPHRSIGLRSIGLYSYHFEYTYSYSVVKNEWIVGCDVRRGVVARRLNYGDVVISVSGYEKGSLVISRVSDPLRLKWVLEEVPRRNLEAGRVEEKLRELEEERRSGRVSESTYLDLRAKYEEQLKKIWEFPKQR